MERFFTVLKMFALVWALFIAGCFPEFKAPQLVVSTDTNDSGTKETGDSGTSDSVNTDTGEDCADADADGFTDASCGGTDCDDSDSAVNLSAAEACTDLTDRNCDGVPGGVDADGDGWAACEECNDSLASVNPGAIELCDGIDNNCDESTDGSDAADAITWYADADGDEYGDSTSGVVACEAPVGFVENVEDCNDANNVVYPGAPETCADTTDYNCDGSIGYADADGDGWAACEECDDSNGAAYPGATESCDSVDNNCDGNVDEGIEEYTYYLDADGDGFGGATTFTTCQTTAPAGYVAIGDDCDDSNGAAYPGALETCLDTADYNCDGSIGYVDADGDGWAACEECDDADADISPDAEEVCDGVDNDCDGSVDGSDATDASIWYADADSDGYGTADTSTIACAAPAGYVSNSEDCDDGQRFTSPAASETCDNGVDDNCDGSVDEDSVCDTGTVDTGAPPDTGTSIDTADTGTVDTGGGSDTSVEDTSGGDTGSSATVFYSTNFGDGGACSTSPWARNDGVSSSAIVYDVSGVCGVNLFGSGSSSGPGSTNVEASSSGYTEDVTYIATLSFFVPSTESASVAVYASFGGGTPETTTIAPGGTGSIVVAWTADATGSATLAAWTSASTNYAAVLDDYTVVFY